VVANVAFWLGVRILAYAPFGQALGLLWGVVVAAVLLVCARVVLHTALLEAAVQDAAGGRRHRLAAADSTCPECETTLLPEAMFCTACGSSVRATTSTRRSLIARPTSAP
jgi:hypothetical protein